MRIFQSFVPAAPAFCRPTLCEVRQILPLLLATCLLSAGTARAQSNLVLLLSQPGDWIGQGGTYATTNESDIGFSGQATTVTVRAFGFAIIFDGPGYNNLAVGKYPNAVRYPFNGGSPGLDVSGHGRGCNGVCGTFEILEISTDGANVNHFWATFTENCECSDPPLTGEVRYHSLLAPPIAIPRTLHVPSEYPTITAAITNTSRFAVDTVLVAPGVYNEAVTFGGRTFRLMSEAGPAQTTLAAGVNFSGGEGTNTLLYGFTIGGGGVYCAYTSCSPTIMSNVITCNGNGIINQGGSPVIRYNTVVGCAGTGVIVSYTSTALVEGNLIASNGMGGLSIYIAGTPVVRNNIIRGNHGNGIDITYGYYAAMNAFLIQNLLVENAGNGIAWSLASGGYTLLFNNTIARNGAAGIYADGYDTTAQIVNNVVVGTPALSVVSSGDGLPPLVIEYNDFYAPTGPACTGLVTNLAGTNGNISANPLFTCAPNGDYRVLPGSPCIDTAQTAISYVPATDLNGVPRILTSVTNGPALMDMGAYEFDAAAPPAPCPYLFCPADVVAVAPQGQSSVAVSYPPPDATPVATVVTVPPSGSVFSAGTNVVNCTATYGTNALNCSFAVNVVLWPTITVQPQNTNVLTGRDFGLSVQATGTAPLAYRWTFEDAALPGATNSTFTLTNAQPTNEGIYKAIVSNYAGQVTSRVAVVRVLPGPPLIVAGPDSTSAGAGSNATFSVSANGSTPMSFQWLKAGTPLAGATASQLTLTNVQLPDATSYQVVVTNLVGAVTSSVATLTLLGTPPWFIQQPLGGSVKATSNFTMTAVARGSEPLSYQWRQNGAAVPGATLTSLAFTNITMAASGSYDVLVTNAFSSITSFVRVLTVIQPPLLLQGLTNQIVDAGSNVLLTVSAICSDPLSYTWGFNNSSIAGTNASLVLSNIQPLQSGYYRVTASAKGQPTSVSSTGRVTVFGPASFVVAWGDNSGGQASPPATLGDVVAIAGGDFHSLALRRNGMLAAWGNNTDGQTNVPPGRFVGIAAGAAHNLAITENGNVVAWGRNDSGQTTVPTNATSVVSVAAGDSHSLALLSSGAVLAWGNNSFGQGRGSGELQGGNYRAIAAGRNHNLGLRTDGSIFAWGLNTFRQASPPSSLTGRLAGVAAIAAGYLHSVALLSNGTVVVWGDNSFGQTNVTSGLSNVVAIAAGDYHTLALRADGTIIGWGDNSAGQISAPVLPSPVAIASGNYHGLALVPKTRLQYAMQSAGLVLQWLGPGILQSAPTPLGPYTDIPGLSQSYTNADTAAPAKFFRVRR